MKFVHQHGNSLITEYEGDFMRMSNGIVEIVKRHTFIGKETDAIPTLSNINEIVAQIALGPGESVATAKSIGYKELNSPNYEQSTGTREA